ncbi:MAG: hypothetical protein ACK5MH_04685 [Bacteroidales bacterium]
MIGLDKIEFSEHIILYPNPSNLKTTLDLGEGNIYGDIIIHNSIGMEVKRLKYNNKALEIDIKGYCPKKCVKCDKEVIL